MRIDLTRYVPNPLLRAELERAIRDHVEDVIVTVLGDGTVEVVPRPLILGLAERCWKQSELLSRKVERA